MPDYSIFYKRAINPGNINKEIENYDIFISAFNSSERVQKVFEEIDADRKFWLIHPEYQYTQIEYPTENSLILPTSRDEISQLEAILLEVGDISNCKVCIDITGFMRHVIVFLIAKFSYLGVKTFTAIYSEPMFYTKQENTQFTTQTSGVVKPISGMIGVNNSLGKDYLILAVGYDNKLINEVTNQKDNSTIYPLFAFPSLSPDMYQQSAISAASSGDRALSSEWVTNRRFAPANDPFATAESIKKIVKEIDLKNESSHQANVYLAPLSTKAQALGMGLYWLLEGKARGAVNVLMPECTSYSRETSHGFKRLWDYTIEL